MTKTLVLNHEQTINYIVAACAARFRSFGRGSRAGIGTNPLAEMLRDCEPQFAAGVDIREVVEFVMSELNS